MDVVTSNYGTAIFYELNSCFNWRLCVMSQNQLHPYHFHCLLQQCNCTEHSQSGLLISHEQPLLNLLWFNSAVEYVAVRRLNKTLNLLSPCPPLLPSPHILSFSLHSCPARPPSSPLSSFALLYSP